MGYHRVTKIDKFGHYYVDTKINDRFMWSKDGKIWERDLSNSAYDGEAIDRLAELEDKIENGTLIELPYKVGQEGYIIRYYDKKIVKAVVGTYDLVRENLQPLVEYHLYGDGGYPLDEKVYQTYDFFLTREEAEAGKIVIVKEV